MNLYCTDSKFLVNKRDKARNCVSKDIASRTKLTRIIFFTSIGHRKTISPKNNVTMLKIKSHFLRSR